jgi:hypothetical protein
MKEMLMKRIEAFGGKGIYPFSEEELRRMYEKADKNPKEFLKSCRDEAIKILIHKRELLDKQKFPAEQLQPTIKFNKAKEAQPQPLKTSAKKTTATLASASDGIMDIKVRKAEERDVEEEDRDEKKKLIRIKFAFGKQEEKPRRPAQNPSFSPRKENKAIYNDEHKEALVNKLSSSSPRRKAQEPEKSKDKKDEKYVSETDKLLRELADEFEIK